MQLYTRIQQALVVVMLAIVVIAFMPARALCQDGGLPFPDPSSMFGSTGSIAAFVVALVAFVRKKVWTTLDGSLVPIVSFALAILLACVGFYFHYLTIATTWAGAIGVGFAAGLLAVGGVSAIQGVTAKASTVIVAGPPVDMTSEPATPAPPAQASTPPVQTPTPTPSP